MEKERRGGKESTYIFHIFNCTAAREGKVVGGDGGALAKEANSVFTADTFLIHFCFAAQQREEAKDAAAATSQHGGIFFFAALFQDVFHSKWFSGHAASVSLPVFFFF